MGRIASSTVTFAVPDPDGQRIGSGAATLNAIHALALHYDKLIPFENGEKNYGDSAVSLMGKKHILLLHAGGDSKRVPWVNPMEKVFLPLPSLAADDPDGPVPLLFDHILAITSCARQAFKNEGGIFTMTGDVLPCFDASTLILPPDASIITVPITLDIAANHGVIVGSRTEILEESYTVCLVDNLLQKPSGGAYEFDEDLVAAWVPTKHDWLGHRPLGEALVSKLGKHRMFSYCAYNLLFLHFGTSSEVLDHLSAADSARIGRRHLCSIPATTVSDIAASAVILSCKIADGVSIGEDSLIYDSNISGGIQIGSQSIVVGINVPEDNDRMADNSVKFMLPDRHCLWEVPLVGCTERVIVFCGIHDNPKNPLTRDGTFCGKPWEKVMHDLGMWLMGLSDGKNQYFLPLWRNSLRVSLEEFHRSIDFPKMCTGSTGHIGCKFRACGEETKACELEHKAWAAVADETASAIRYGFAEHLLDSSCSKSTSACGNNNHDGSMDQSFCSRIAKVELPVRVDFVGGWSDTPPWSLECAGCVLNMAVSLEGSLPIGTIVETTNSSGVLISDDSGNELHIREPTSITPPFDGNDPFRLVKSALLVTGIIHVNIPVSNGLRIRTWAHVPRGTGLGTSSILAAAVVKELLQIINGDDSNENVARLVLVLEQLMGTGGGWQDQIGGLYPGIKFTTIYPGIPLRLQVFPLVASPQLISELPQRLLLVLQVRLAHEVLQKVVLRYLQRDNLLASSIKRLTELAKIGREALMNCDVDKLGEIMLEAWRLHQELDPYFRNEYVDKLFAFADPYCSGYKLVGAGGGGFALLLAKDATCAKELRIMLEKNPEFDSVIYNWSVY
ncbi:hypothetical protein REPUB_Repub17cG0141600 [Reevesia pubescens]